MENQILDAPETTDFHGEYAGFGTRLVAALLDGILLYIVQIAIFSIFGVSSTLTGGGMMDETGGISSGLIFAYILSTLVGVAYYAYFESSEKQATLGKQAMGLVVTDIDGQRISMGRAIGRYFAKILSAIILLIGYLMQPFTQRKQALHDIVAGTLVYKKR